MLAFFKIKNECFSKDITKKISSQNQRLGKIHKTYLMQNLCPEYIKSSISFSVGKGQLIFRNGGKSRAGLSQRTMHKCPEIHGKSWTSSAIGEMQSKSVATVHDMPLPGAKIREANTTQSCREHRTTRYSKRGGCPHVRRKEKGWQMACCSYSGRHLAADGNELPCRRRHRWI